LQLMLQLASQHQQLAAGLCGCCCGQLSHRLEASSQLSLKNAKLTIGTHQTSGGYTLCYY
jgi:hypothetical protein